MWRCIEGETSRPSPLATLPYQPRSRTNPRNAPFARPPTSCRERPRRIRGEISDESAGSVPRRQVKCRGTCERRSCAHRSTNAASAQFPNVRAISVPGIPAERRSVRPRLRRDPDKSGCSVPRANWCRPRSKGGGRPSARNAPRDRRRADAAGDEWVTRGHLLAQLSPPVNESARGRFPRQVVSGTCEWRSCATCDESARGQFPAPTGVYLVRGTVGGRARGMLHS